MVSGGKMTESSQVARPPEVAHPERRPRTVAAVLPRARSRLVVASHRHGLAVLALCLSTFIHLVVVTDGTFALLAPPARFPVYYDELGKSLLDGRLDVPAAAIGWEAFLINGKYYGYFGPTPAILRIPLNALFPSMWGRWSRIFLLGSAFLTLLACYFIFLDIMRRFTGRAILRPTERWVAAGVILCVGLGSPLLFISRIPFVYHEASTVAVAFTMLSFAALLSYLRDPRLWKLPVAVILALLAYFGRGSVGMAPLFSCSLMAGIMGFSWLMAYFGLPRGLRASNGLSAHLVGPDMPRQGLHAIWLIATLACGIGLAAYRNVAVMGNITGVPSLHQHVSASQDAARLAITQGRFVQPQNVRTTLYNYLRPDGVTVAPTFPWFSSVPKAKVRTFPETRLDWVECFVSVTAVYPFWLLVGALGFAVMFMGSPVPAVAPYRLLFVGTMVGCTGFLFGIAVSWRYLHDAFPLLFISGAVGVARTVVVRETSPLVWVFAPLLALAGLYTNWVSLVTTMVTAGSW